jgi:hypothetical protein
MASWLVPVRRCGCVCLCLLPLPLRLHQSSSLYPPRPRRRCGCDATRVSARCIVRRRDESGVVPGRRCVPPGCNSLPRRPCLCRCKRRCMRLRQIFLLLSSLACACWQWTSVEFGIFGSLPVDADGWQSANLQPIIGRRGFGRDTHKREKTKRKSSTMANDGDAFKAPATHGRAWSMAMRSHGCSRLPAKVTMTSNQAENWTG